MRSDAGYGNLSQSMDNLEDRINNAIQLSQQLSAKSKELESRQLATSEPDLYQQYMGESSSSFLESLAYHREKLRNEARSRILDFSDITGDLGTSSNYDSNNNNLDSTPLSARYMPTGVTSKPEEDSNDEDYGTRNGISSAGYAPTSHFHSSNYVPTTNYAAMSSYDNAGGYQSTASKAPVSSYSPIYSQHEPLGLSKTPSYAPHPPPPKESMMADSLEPKRYSGMSNEPQKIQEEDAVENEEEAENEGPEEANEDADGNEAMDGSETIEDNDEGGSLISEDTKVSKGVQTKGSKNSKDFIDKNKKEVWKNRKGSYAVIQARKAEQDKIEERVNAFKKRPSRLPRSGKKDGCTCKDKEEEGDTANEEEETQEETPEQQESEVQVEDVAEENLDKTPDDEEQEVQDDGAEQEVYDGQQEYAEEQQEEEPQYQEEITPDNALPRFIERYGSNVPMHPMDYPNPYYNIYPHLYPYGADPYSAPGSIGGETPQPEASYKNGLPPLRNPRVAGIPELSAILRGEERTYSHSAGAGDPRYRNGYLHRAAMYPDPYLPDPYMMPPPVPGFDFMYSPYDYVIPGIPPAALGRMDLGPNEVRRSTSQPNLNDPRIQNTRLPPLVPQKSDGQPSVSGAPVTGPANPVSLNRSVSVGAGRETSAASGSNPSRASSAVHSAALTRPVKALPRSLGPDVLSDDYVEKRLKAQRQREYADVVREQRRMALMKRVNQNDPTTSSTAPLNPSPLASDPVTKPMMSRRDIPQRGPANEGYESAVDVMRRRHEEEKRAIDRMRHQLEARMQNSYDGINTI